MQSITCVEVPAFVFASCLAEVFSAANELKSGFTGWSRATFEAGWQSAPFTVVTDYVLDWREFELLTRNLLTGSAIRDNVIFISLGGTSIEDVATVKGARIKNIGMDRAATFGQGGAWIIKLYISSFTLNFTGIA